MGKAQALFYLGFWVLVILTAWLGYRYGSTEKRQPDE